LAALQKYNHDVSRQPALMLATYIGSHDFCLLQLPWAEMVICGHNSGSLYACRCNGLLGELLAAWTCVLRLRPCIGQMGRRRLQKQNG